MVVIHKGEFKTGILEFELLNRTYDRHCIDNYAQKHNMSINLVVTHMDVLKDGEHYNFDFIDRVGLSHSCIGMNKKWAIKEVGKHFMENLCYKPDHIYYNDSVESNIKLFK